MNRARFALLMLLAGAAGHAQEAEHDHAQQDHPATQTGQRAAQPDSVLDPVPQPTAADRAAAQAPRGRHEFHDNDLHGYLLLDRMEYRNGDPGNSVAWEVKGWLGTDLDRLWLRTEGERARGDIEAADAELLYGHSISAWWDLLGGVRQDFRPGEARTWLAVGVQGLAPQRFEISATAYVGTQRRTAAHMEAEYRVLFTNRLILQPVLELWWYGKGDAARGIGSGLATAQTGLRLRYEFARRFAPYFGIEYERALGDTAALHRAADTAVSDTRLVLGLRTWF